MAILLWGWVSPAAAQIEAAQTGPSGDEWAEESAEALADLAASGMPSATVEGDPDTVLPPDDQNGPWGFAGLRVGYRPEIGPDMTSRLRLAPGPWRLKARWRAYVDGHRQTALAGGYEGTSVSVFLGYLGFQHGYGLLSAAPGRTPSLSADQGLMMGSSRVRGWTGTSDDRTLVGCAVELRRGGWSCLGLMGTGPTTLPAPGTGNIVLRLAKAGPAGSLGVGVVSRPTGRGWGVTGRVTRRLLKGGTEVLVWQARRDGPLKWAGVAALRWEPGNRTFLEAGLAAADAGVGWGPGHRPALLPGWIGQGYSLRGGLRTPAGLKLRALVHQGLAEAEEDGGDRQRRRLLDLQAGRRITGDWETFLRVRRTSWTRWDRIERHPWLPAEAVTTRLQTVVSLSFVHERGGWRSSFLLRTLGQETPGDTGRRSILAGTVRGRPGPAWLVRGFLATAWGDDVDLVTAVVPLSGLVLARHWGRWRSGTGAGLGWSFGGFLVQAAVGYRRAEPGRGETDEIWGQFSFEGKW